MNDTVTIPREEYANLLTTVGRADACVAFLIHEYNGSEYHTTHADLILQLLGVDIPQTDIPQADIPQTVVTE